MERSAAAQAPRVRRPWSALVVAAFGAVVAAASSVLAHSGRVGSVERAAFEAVNGLPNVLEWPMWSLQLVGLLLTPLVVVLVGLVLRKWRLAVAALLLIPLKLAVEREVLKQLVDRQRPGLTEVDPILRGVPASGNSFPSGHAIIAFGLATLLAPYLSRRWQVVVWTLAVLNGVARVYLGAHNPLDIIGGAGVGVAIGGALTFICGVHPRARRGQELRADPRGT
ncbi:MAG TPA: phosphatase PAP2 family protein [Nocardioidaceae bacterium]